MTVHQFEPGEVVVLRVHGPLDAADVAELREHLARTRTTRGSGVVVDLGPLARIGAAGVAALAGLTAEAESLGGVRLVVCGAAAGDALSGAVAEGLVRWSPSVAEAVRGVRGEQVRLAVRRLPRVSGAARYARDLVRHTVPRTHRDLAERAVLVTNEIVADLVAGPAARRRQLSRSPVIEVEVSYQSDVVRVCVLDPARSGEVLVHVPQELAAVLATFVDAWGCHRLPGGGTCVWCRLSGPPGSDPPDRNGSRA
jgi:ABC-type transporter Mla MlaB component